MKTKEKVKKSGSRAVGVGLALPVSGSAEMRGRQAVPLRQGGVVRGKAPGQSACGFSCFLREQSENVYENKG
jgi:hypothetical protein